MCSTATAVILCFLVAVSQSYQELPVLVGSEFVGSGWDAVTQTPRILPIVKNEPIPVPENAVCSGYVSGDGPRYHCLYVEGNDQSYSIPAFMTAESITDTFEAELKVFMLTAESDFHNFWKEVIVHEDDDWFSSTVTTTTIIKYYFTLYKRSMQMAASYRNAEIYSIGLDSALLHILALEKIKFLDDHFIESVENLPETYNRADPVSFLQYQLFIRYFGTHVITQVDMGGVTEMLEWYNQCFILNGNFNSTFVVESTKGLMHSYLDVDYDASLHVDSCFLYNAYTKFTYRGGKGYQYRPSNSTEWVRSVYDAPFPIRKQVSNIAKFVGWVDPSKVPAMKQALDDYVNDATDAAEQIKSMLREKASNYLASCCSLQKTTKKEPGGICQAPISFDKSFSCQDVLSKFLGDLKVEKPKISTPGERKNYLPRSVINMIGFNIRTSECKDQVTDPKYNNQNFWTNSISNETYLIPDGLVASQIGAYAVTESPVLEISELDTWLSLSVGLELSWDTLLSMLLNVILRPFAVSNIDASVTASIAAALEAEGAVMILGSSQYEMMGAASYPYKTIQGQENSKFQREIQSLPDYYDYDAYSSVICNYGTHYLSKAVYGGQVVIAFKMNADLFAEAAAWFMFQAEAAISLLQCLLGLFNGSHAGAAFACAFPDPEFWAKVSFTITIVGGNVPELLASFDYSRWLDTVAQNPALLRTELVPLNTLIEEPQASFLGQAIEEYETTGNITCPSRMERSTYSSTCYPVVSFLPLATFSCQTTNFTECITNLNDCCSIKLG